MRKFIDYRPGSKHICSKTNRRGLAGFTLTLMKGLP